MELTFPELSCLGRCLEGFFFGTISVSCQAQVAKVVQHFPIPGLYSGIFAMYLQHHGSPQRTEKTKSILFYALSVVYTLSATTIITDILVFSWPGAVSMNYHGCLIFLKLVVQSVEVVYHLQIIQGIAFAFCDFIAQSVLVRTI